MLLLQSVTS